MRIGFIGSGLISSFHIAALKNNNFSIEAIGTRKESKNCLKMANELNLLDKYCNNGWEEVLNKKVDAFCLCVNTSKTPEILLNILELNKPVLVEKPVAWQIQDIDNISKHRNSDKIFVAYNRRFYKTLKTLKGICNNSPEGGTVFVNIPDSIAGIKQFISNGCHMVDSLRYILGDFEIIDKLIRYDPNKNDLVSISALCKTKKFNILFNAHSLIPSNFSISINISEMVYELKPLEKLTVFKGMEVLEPTKEDPIRKYNPSIESSFIESSLYKPGFDNMYKSFHSFIKKKGVDSFCTINDAKKTLAVCWELLDMPENIRFDS